MYILCAGGNETAGLQIECKGFGMIWRFLNRDRWKLVNATAKRLISKWEEKKQQNNGAKKQLKTPGEKQTQGEKL